MSAANHKWGSWDEALWSESAVEYDGLRGDRVSAVNIDSAHAQFLRGLLEPSVSVDSAYAQIQSQPRPTPQTVVEAILYCVRARGVAALKEPANIERLSRCDEAATKEINERIAKMLAAEEKIDATAGA